MEIKLIDLIQLAGVTLDDFKIHCATGANPTPLEAFFDGKFQQWQEPQNQKNFECRHILSLIHLGGTRWLFAGVYEVLGVAPGKWKPTNCYMYSTREILGLDHLTGRALIEFDKVFRASYLRGKRYADQLRVVSIREQRMTIGDFPGFNSIILSHRMLQTLVRELNPSWRSALSNVSGVYLITDTLTGKHYVGSAYGGEGIWQRWTAYATTGHGGNKELRELLEVGGPDHVHFFQYTLLEVCDINSSNDQIIARETHWKIVLRSREFGLNSN
ncbi:MAG: GIY-YIG nuclease family protein [Desulfobacteraceae bacterium]|nr:MAG: GIY-YIG nuclease family protein [Desulfobacteraceae bacterium]